MNLGLHATKYDISGHEELLTHQGAVYRCLERALLLLQVGANGDSSVVSFGRKLRSCPRTNLHTHLFVSFILKAAMWVAMDSVSRDSLDPDYPGVSMAGLAALKLART